MATNQTGIAIVIKAFLPTGKTIDEQFEALSIVKTAHETGDYSAVLKAATIDEVKSEQKTRRVEDAPAPLDLGGTTEKPTEAMEPSKNIDGEKTEASTDKSDEEIPEFLKADKKGKAA